MIRDKHIRKRRRLIDKINGNQEIIMGRTARKRRRQQIKFLSTINDEDSLALEQLRQWMSCLGWSKTCNLIPTVFPVTGRGLKTLEDITAGSPIIQIPKRLLITTHVVAQSNIRYIFRNEMSYAAQCVLAAFLVYEKHMQEHSEWRFYIKTLPNSYTVPNYCTKAEQQLLPSIITVDMLLQAQKIVNNYRTIVWSILKLQKTNNDKCQHCGLNLMKVFTFSAFKWGYFTVNTRAVYIDSKNIINNDINICGENNLALAPLLDLFNHSLEASVDVSLYNNGVYDIYQIKTMKSFEGDSQVFINYGSHTSAKLYLEYGFFIPNNHLDEVKINYYSIKKFLLITEAADKFILINKFAYNMAFTSAGLNYHGQIVLFVIKNAHLTDCEWKKKIYCTEFNDNDLMEINEMGCEILNVQRGKFVNILERMMRKRRKSESFNTAIYLINEYIYLLDRCSDNLKKS